MVAAVDPTYPLYPMASFLAAGMLLLILMTSLVRQSWNLGIAFLCFWLFIANFTDAVNAIIWAENADIKLYVYCDIVTHLQIVASVVAPMSTLIITRRLYLIASLQTVELPGASAKRRNMVIEWTLGLLIPVLVAGPLYYTVQPYRFEVIEGFGCVNTLDNSLLACILVNSWTILPPLASVLIYYPRVVLTFYRQGRDINHFLRSNNSEMSRASYIRILALASIDLLLNLPIGIIALILYIIPMEGGHTYFYSGWAVVHSAWQPRSFSYQALLSTGPVMVSQFYFSSWAYPILSFVIFGFFGVSSEARASYWHVICTVCGWFGWKPTLRTRKARSPLGDIEFGERPTDLENGSYPSYVNPDVLIYEQDGETGKPVTEQECGPGVEFEESG
ncbi:unnamed protein product [Peniophora sp. CBMAI 1063]|nr:unnamed protein product [Peniophora sp. CBMAI 1063]